MAETAPNYPEVLQQALLARKDWLEKDEINKLKDELRIFQVSFSVLYNMFLKKKLIDEDPYKQETRISELSVPETGPLNEAKRMEQISLRLSSYDSMLDFLVNFYQFEIDFLNLERIRKIVGLVRYIDWVNLTPDSKSHNTRLVAEFVNNSKSGGDAFTLSVIGDSLSKLPKGTNTIIGILKNIDNYQKEVYKLSVRGAIAGMSAGEANPNSIKKKMASALPGTPFYQALIEELIREDYSKDGPALKEAILKSLKVAEAKPKAAKPKTSYIDILLTGLQAIGAAESVVKEIALKIDENQTTLENHKKGFWEKVRQLFRSMAHGDGEATIYELHFKDLATGAESSEELNFDQFRLDLDKKINNYSKMAGQSSFMAALKTKKEEDVLHRLEWAIKDLKNLHRTLTALDEFFRSSVPPEDRGKIKGIKPELSAIKNCYVKADQIRHEYSAEREEEEQMKKLGINPDA